MMDSSFWYLESGDVTSMICAEKLAESQNIDGRQLVKKGEYVYFNKQSTDNIFLIIKGRILIGTYIETNQEVPIAILQTGDIFGQLSLIKQLERDDYAIASEDSELCVMGLEDLKTSLKDEAMVNALLMKMMGSRVHEMENRLESLLFKDSKTRIVEFMLKAIEKNGQRLGYEWMVRNFSTHLEIANLTATSRQTVTMILNELRNEKIIDFDRKRLLVRDLAKLKSIVQHTNK
jgi:CRP/FNR family transcriptional regulator, cyclic AMP receptor protein